MNSIRKCMLLIMLLFGVSIMLPISASAEEVDRINLDHVKSAFVQKEQSTYLVGDTLDIDDITMWVVDQYGNIKSFTGDEINVDTSKVNMYNARTYMISVSLKEKKDIVGYRIIEVTSTTPAIFWGKKREVYNVGDTLNVDDIKVQSLDARGKKDITGNYTVDTEDVDMSKEGHYDLQIKDNDPDGCSYSVRIYVYDNQFDNEFAKIESVDVTKDKKDYYVGDTVSLDDLKVTVHYKDGTTKEISRDDDKVSAETYYTNINSLDVDSSGTKDLKVCYLNRYYNVPLTFSNKPLQNIRAQKVQKTYVTGEKISLDDLTVTAEYGDGTTEELAADDYTTNIAGIDTSQVGEVSLVITYTSNGITKTDEVTLTIKAETGGDEKKAALDSIQAVKTKKEYEVGDTIKTDDITVTATYEDGTTAEVTGFTTNADQLSTAKAGTYILMVTYEENGVEKTIDLLIVVKEKDAGSTDDNKNNNKPLQNIRAQKVQKTYVTGEKISLDDLTVTAEYSDGSTKELAAGDYTTNIAGIDTSQVGEVSLVITYTSNGITKTDEVTLTIKAETGGDEKKAALDSIQAVKTKKEYEVGDTIKTDDITVTATYEDGTTAEVTGFTTNADQLSTAKAGTYILMVTYEENGVEKTIDLLIVVKEKDAGSTPEQTGKDDSTDDNKNNNNSSNNDGENNSGNNGSNNNNGNNGNINTPGNAPVQNTNATSGSSSTQGTTDLKAGNEAVVGDVTGTIIDVTKKEAAYTRTDSKAAKLTVPSTVTIAGTTYKVTQIADNAFAKNKKVTQIVIGKNVEVIGKSAFKGAKKLTTLIITSDKLTKKGLRNSLKGSSVKTIKLKGKAKKMYKKYCQYFVKSNCGRRVKIKK